jgi:hypothetical protein
MAIPRTTHPWLQPFYDCLQGKGSSVLNIGSSTGILGLYGASGFARVATGGNGILSATYIGASGFASTGLGASGLYVHLARFADNGGSGTPYTLSDIVRQMKNMGALPQ